MKKWRFKTEQEFKNQFGENWRVFLRYAWNDEMDEFFGVTIWQNAIDNLVKNDIAFHKGFAFNKDYITTDELK